MDGPGPEVHAWLSRICWLQLVMELMEDYVAMISTRRSTTSARIGVGY